MNRLSAGYLILPFGLHWSEARAGDMIVSDEIIAQVPAPAEHDQFPRAEREQMFLDAMKCVLDRDLPGNAS